MALGAMGHYLDDRPDLGKDDAFIMACLADWANDRGECSPSIAELAKRARITPRGATKAIRRLEDAGELIIMRGAGFRTKSGKTSLYVLASYAKLRNGLATDKPEGVNSSSPLDNKRGVPQLTPLDPKGCPPVHPLSEKMPEGVNSSSPNTNTNTDTYVSVASQPSPLPLSDAFHALLAELKTSKNKAAVLRQIYILCYGDSAAPQFGYIAKVAKQVGGAGYLAGRLWELTARPPTGDVLAYILAEHKARANGRANGTGEDHRAVVDLKFAN